MNRVKMILCALALTTIAACNKEELSQEVLRKSADLSGTWRLTETGYSPGAGYIVEPVPSQPTQLLILNKDGSVSSTIEGWKNYSFYTVDPDTLSDNSTITFYEGDPGNPNSSVLETYLITFADDMLKLHNPRCIEGCHSGFIPVE